MSTTDYRMGEQGYDREQHRKHVLPSGGGNWISSKACSFLDVVATNIGVGHGIELVHSNGIGRGAHAGISTKPRDVQFTPLRVKQVEQVERGDAANTRRRDR